jgi:hypothetical protein
VHHGALAAVARRIDIDDAQQVAGMIVNGRSLGSRASTDVRSGVGLAEFQISWKSAPTEGPCIG